MRENSRKALRKSLRTPEHTHLIALLRQERHRAGLTQQQVAERLGSPQSFVAKVEGGERRIDLVEFIAIARALEADPVELLTLMLEPVRADTPVDSPL